MSHAGFGDMAFRSFYTVLAVLIPVVRSRTGCRSRRSLQLKLQGQIPDESQTSDAISRTSSG
ncbi:hypothetical protein PYCCODRAFT_1431464, partial [Trametes coccinea BRFM310]